MIVSDATDVTLRAAVDDLIATGEYRNALAQVTD